MLTRISFQAPTKVPPLIMNNGGGLAYDSARQRLVQFGGSAPTAPFAASAKVFVFDPDLPERGWHQVFPDGPGPAARSDHGWVYDVDLDRFLLFGGFLDNFDLPTDLWALSGDLSTWTLLKADAALGNPPARWQIAMAYDKARKTTTLFGGVASDFTTELQDIWEHNGLTNTWTDRTPGSIPTEWPVVRLFSGVGYDDTRGKVVIFGGSTGGFDFTALNDLWTWGGPTELMIEQGSAVLPPGRRVRGMFVYHSALGGMMLRGGDNQTIAFADDFINTLGDGWRELHPATVPPGTPGQMPSARFDVDGSVIYTAGQESNVGPFPAFHETWTLTADEEWVEPTAGLDYNPVEIEVSGGARLADASSVDDSKLETVVPFVASLLTGFVATETTPGSDIIVYAIIVDGQARWWDTGLATPAWADSDSTAAQMSSAAVIAANLATLSLGGRAGIKVALRLISDDGSTTPEVDQIEVTFADAAEQCVVSGTALDLQGAPISGATVRATHDAPTELDDALTHPSHVETTTAADGSWSLALAQGVTVNVCITEDTAGLRRVRDFTGLVIPATDTADFNDLTT